MQQQIYNGKVVQPVNPFVFDKCYTTINEFNAYLEVTGNINILNCKANDKVFLNRYIFINIPEYSGAAKLHSAVYQKRQDGTQTFYLLIAQLEEINITNYSEWQEF